MAGQTDDQNRLYQHENKYIPRIAAVHDMCGYGKCSLTAAIPILSAAGCDVCPVPTALFSAHTMFKDYTFHDTTEMLPGYLDAWQKEGVDLDGIYSGFLGSAEQVDIIQRMYRQYPKALRLVDPVMGDGGSMYPTYTEEMCRAVSHLVEGADLLMPNLTEVSLLTGIDYEGQNLDDAQVGERLCRLLDMGAKNVIIKGIDRKDGKLRNFVASADHGGVSERTELVHDKLPFMIHGTGDAFASSLCGALFAGQGLADAARIAGEFVRSAMQHTRNQPDYQQRGVSFELDLGQMTALMQEQ